MAETDEPMLTAKVRARLWATVLDSQHGVTVAVFDREGTHLDVMADPEMGRRCGMDPKSLIGRTILDVFGPEGEPLMELIRSGFDTGKAVHVPCYPFPSTVGPAWHEANFAPVCDDSGEVLAVAAFIRDVTDRIEAERELLAARARVEDAREQERKAMAMDLHDSLGQELVAARVLLGAGRADAAYEQLGRIIESVRTISRGLYPTTLSAIGLDAALEQLCEGCPIATEIEIASVEALRLVRESVQIVVFRIVQEATTNAAKHSEARQVAVRVHLADGSIHVHVADDGVGFDATGTHADGTGLISMTERVRGVGGTLRVSSEPGRTEVFAEIPAG